MSDLEYHRHDPLQEFDAQAEKTRQELDKENLEKDFSPKRQRLVLIIGLVFLLSGVLASIRYGLWHDPNLIDLSGPRPRARIFSGLVPMLVGLIFVFFSCRNLLRKKQRK